MKKIPYGVIDYKSLIEEDYIYVDKTMYLSKLENERKTLIYLKPGRFGKSLFTSMMYYYYDVNSSSDFETLFKGTYVYDNPTPNKNNYYVLKFDFSGLTTVGMTKEEMKLEFKMCVKTGINDFISRYNIEYNIDLILSPNVLLKDFLSVFKTMKLDKKIYILVDEYDNFTNGILEGDASLFKSVVNHNGFVKSFYAVIKEYVGLGVVDRFFATGICPITLNSMTTGFNIATDISTKQEYNSMIGLTHEEVKCLICELGISEDEVYDVMLRNYDGYRFSENTEERVFNATLVMYFLKEYLNNHEVPDVLYDNNIVVNYGKIDNLLKLQGNSFYKDIISDILDNGEITGVLKTQFNLVEDFTRDDIISLLYYFGYLTIKEQNIIGKMVFRVPNYVMKETYGNYFLKILKDMEVEVDTKVQDSGLMEIVTEGKIDIITKYISEILTKIDNRLFVNMNERDIELLYFTLIKNDLINVYTEYPVNGGYADVYIFGRVKPLKYNILIEIKYIKKSDYSDSVLESKKEEARKQLEKYSMDERINTENLRKYIVIFVGNDVKLLESVD